MKSICALLLILVLLEVLCCEGCLKEEREGLLVLKSHMGNMGNLLSSWVDNTDCCLWLSVKCNTTTGRVVELHLQRRTGSTNLEPWHPNYSDFIVFKDLKILDLQSNYITGCTQTDQGFENLEFLDLSASTFDNATGILSCLDGLSSLKSLSLSTNSLDGIPFHRLCATLKNLEVLDMSSNSFSDIDIASTLSELSSLKSLSLRANKITLRSIHNISKLRSLEILDLGSNDLNENILWPLENGGFAWPTSLQVLGLSFNSFSDNVLSRLSGLPSLKSLDLSHNQLKLRIN